MTDSRPRIRPYDPRWRDRFDGTATALRAVLGGLGAEVHHVGSTSVPGCSAKDRIDVLVCIDRAAPGADIVSRMAGTGFTHERAFATSLPERILFHRGGIAGINVHVERLGLPGSVRDPRLVFRDALRADDALRDAYGALKLRLAAEHHEMESYTEAKSDFIWGVLGGATAAGDRVGVHIRGVAPDEAAATSMLSAYVTYLATNAPHGYDCATDFPPPPGAFQHPNGTFLVMFDDVEPIGCGAVWRLAPGLAEIRRMWVLPQHHGRGLGRRMLDALESAAVALGCHTARLDSMTSLEAAVAMYRSQGYEEIDDYNSNPNATIWMQRSLL